MTTETKKRMIPLGDAPLPPAGDERRDELKRREDTLTEAAERLSEQQEVYKIDEKAVAVDRELAQNFNPHTLSMLTVTKPQPGWEYCWANFVNQSGLQVMMKKYDGWVVVSGTDPENMEHKEADGTRRVGDVLLMRIPEAKKAALDRRDAMLHERRHRGVASELEELGRKYHGRGLKVHTPEYTSDEGSNYRDRGFDRQEASYDPRRRLVRQEAARVLGDMAKEQIPGVPLPGKG